MDPIYSKLQIFLLFIVVSVNSLSLPANVQQMEVLDIENADVNSLLANHRIFDYLKKVDKSSQAQLTLGPKLGNSFKWQKCDHVPGLFNLTNLHISPDPLHFPGDVYLQVAGTLKERVDAPLKVDLLLKKEITAAFWITVPCIDGIGSCTYDDMCETLQGATCPDSFVKYDIPCKCPFPPGSFKLPESDFKAKVKDIPSGKYSLQANISYGAKHVACFNIYFSIEE